MGRLHAIHSEVQIGSKGRVNINDRQRHAYLEFSTPPWPVQQLYPASYYAMWPTVALTFRLNEHGLLFTENRVWNKF